MQHPTGFQITPNNRQHSEESKRQVQLENHEIYSISSKTAKTHTSVTPTDGYLDVKNTN